MEQFRFWEITGKSSTLVDETWKFISHVTVIRTLEEVIWNCFLTTITRAGWTANHTELEMHLAMNYCLFPFSTVIQDGAFLWHVSLQAFLPIFQSIERKIIPLFQSRWEEGSGIVFPWCRKLDKALIGTSAMAVFIFRLQLSDTSDETQFVMFVPLREWYPDEFWF